LIGAFGCKCLPIRLRASVRHTRRYRHRWPTVSAYRSSCPATTAGCVAIAIRNAADRIWSIRNGGSGIFRSPKRVAILDEETAASCSFRLRLQSRQNIVVSDYGSGNDLDQALIARFQDERWDIEDARELVMDLHPIREIVYSRRSGVRVTPKQLVESCCDETRSFLADCAPRSLTTYAT